MNLTCHLGIPIPLSAPATDISKATVTFDFVSFPNFGLGMLDSREDLKKAFEKVGTLMFKPKSDPVLSMYFSEPSLTVRILVYLFSLQQYREKLKLVLLILAFYARRTLTL